MIIATQVNYRNGSRRYYPFWPTLGVRHLAELQLAQTLAHPLISRFHSLKSCLYISKLASNNRHCLTLIPICLGIPNPTLDFTEEPLYVLQHRLTLGGG